MGRDSLLHPIQAIACGGGEGCGAWLVFKSDCVVFDEQVDSAKRVQQDKKAYPRG